MKAELEIAHSFAEFEAINEPYTIQVRGVSLWPLLRVAVGFSMQKLPLSLATLTRSQLIIAILRSAGGVTWQPPLNANYIVKSYASSLRIEGAHGYEDVFFDELLKTKPEGVRMHSLNVPSYANRHHGIGSTNVDCTAVHALGSVLGRLFPVQEGKEAYAKLSGLIMEQLGVGDFSAERIAHIFGSFWWQAQLFKRQLENSSVKTVIAADSEEKALVFACRSLGIRFVELQHGVLNPSDPLCLPAVALQQASAQKLLLPDVLALYGDYWTERHTNTAMGELGRISAFGSAIIDQYRERRKAGFQPNLENPQIVITTQGLDRDALITFIINFLLEYKGACAVMIKLHPAYDRSPEPYAKALSKDSRVEILSGQADLNTYELISRADLHISIASACHFDALGIGTPTAVLNLRGSDAVQDLVDNGDALYLKTPADLAHVVAMRSWAKVPEQVSNKYFKPDFLGNILHLVQ